VNLVSFAIEICHDARPMYVKCILTVWNLRDALLLEGKFQDYLPIYFEAKGISKAATQYKFQNS